MKTRGPDKAPRTRRTKAELGKAYTPSMAHQIYCRVTDAEKAAVFAKLKANGLSLSDYIRSCVPETSTRGEWGEKT